MNEELNDIDIFYDYVNGNECILDMSSQMIVNQLGKDIFLMKDSEIGKYIIEGREEDIKYVLDNKDINETELYNELVKLYSNMLYLIEIIYNSPIQERETKALFMVIPSHDYDKITYVYANSEFDAVLIYNKMCGCLVPETIAIKINKSVILEGYTHKTDSKISFKRQCELNNFYWDGDNTKVEI